MCERGARQSPLHSLVVFECHEIVIPHVAAFGERRTAGFDGAARPPTEKPVQYVDRMDVVLDNQIAGEFLPATPCAYLLVFGTGARRGSTCPFALAFDEMRTCVPGEQAGNIAATTAGSN